MRAAVGRGGKGTAARWSPSKRRRCGAGQEQGFARRGQNSEERGCVPEGAWEYQDAGGFDGERIFRGCKADRGDARERGGLETAREKGDPEECKEKGDPGETGKEETRRLN